MDHLYFWQCLLNGHSISSYSWYQVAERETPYKDKTLFIYIFAIRWILDSQRQQRESEKEQNLLLNLICIIYLLFKTWKRAGGERTIEQARELFMSGYFYCYRWKFVRKVFVFPLFQCLSGEGSCCIFIRYSNIRSEINTKCDTANRVILRKYDISVAQWWSIVRKHLQTECRWASTFVLLYQYDTHIFALYACSCSHRSRKSVGKAR